MRVEKKRILKEDGRYLIFYHFPQTATAEQTAAFQAVAAPVEVIGEETNAQSTGNEGERRV